jgi:hypothetical protein
MGKSTHSQVARKSDTSRMRMPQNVQAQVQEEQEHEQTGASQHSEQQAGVQSNSALAKAGKPTVTLNNILNLQRTIGNNTVMRLLKQQKPATSTPSSARGSAAVQRVRQDLGGFASPAGAQRAQLLQVLNNIGRSAARAIDYCTNDPSTTLIFTTGVTGGDLGETTFEAFVGGGWHNLDAICNVGNQLGLLLNRDTPIRITMLVDPAAHGPTNDISASLTHEITVHGVHAIHWLQKLRGGAYNGVQIRGEWRRSLDGGLLDADNEHDTFSQGYNRAYNQTAYNIFNNGGGMVFHDDIEGDMDDHRPVGGVVKYPW